jgi:glycine hydroxymethyltransferase
MTAANPAELSAPRLEAATGSEPGRRPGSRQAAEALLSAEALVSDPELGELLRRELKRQRTGIQLIASENFTSLSVLAASASVLTNKYSEGYPGRRYYGGNIVADEVEELARTRLASLFGAQYANVQPHAGAQANLGAYFALVDPGDTVLAMRLDQGGHLTHGSPVSVTGKLYRFVAYGVTPAAVDGSGERIDFDLVRDLAKRERPRLIVAGATAYSRAIDPAPFREIADDVGARLMFDIAHPAGLVAAGEHPNPTGIADVVTLTTHKTLRGPRGGAILASAELGRSFDSAVFPGLQGGPLMHTIAAKAVAFAEAATPQFKTYAAQVRANARALAGALAGEGFRLVAGGTDNHLLLVDLRDFDDDLTGKVAQETLDRAGVTCNRNQIPNDPRSPFVTSGLRLGTAAETTAGMREPQMATIGALIARALRNRDDERQLGAIRSEVAELCAQFDPYPDGGAVT